MKPCYCGCSSRKVKRGLWSPDEDDKLKDFIGRNGIKCWSLVPTEAGLQRCGKSCRLRWLNYLRPGLKRGNFTIQEQQLIIELQTLFGNKWSWIAKRIPGRTDNEIKNFWNAYKARNTSRHVAPHDSSFRMAVPFQTDDNVTVCAAMVEERIKSDSSSNGTSSFEGFVPHFCEESSNEIEPPSTLYMESWMDDLPLWQDDDAGSFDMSQLMRPFE